MRNYCSPHIETSQLICKANQVTGFYMRGKLDGNRLSRGKVFIFRFWKDDFFLFCVSEVKSKTGNAKAKTASVSNSRICNFVFSLQSTNELITKTSKVVYDETFLPVTFSFLKKSSCFWFWLISVQRSSFHSPWKHQENTEVLI